MARWIIEEHNARFQSCHFSAAVVIDHLINEIQTLAVDVGRADQNAQNIPEEGFGQVANGGVGHDDADAVDMQLVDVAPVAE